MEQPENTNEQPDPQVRRGRPGRRTAEERQNAVLELMAGNALAERTIRTLKEECLWLRDWESVEELETALAAWMVEFNEKRPHQALAWQTPAERRARLLATPPVLTQEEAA